MLLHSTVTATEPSFYTTLLMIFFDAIDMKDEKIDVLLHSVQSNAYSHILCKQ